MTYYYNSAPVIDIQSDLLLPFVAAPKSNLIWPIKFMTWDMQTTHIMDIVCRNTNTICRCGWLTSQGAAVAKIKLHASSEKKAIKARRVYECDARTFVRRLDTFQQHNEGLISANNEVALHYYYSYFLAIARRACVERKTTLYSPLAHPRTK